MNNEFDINKITSEFLKDFLNEKFEATFQGFKGLLKKTKEESKFLFRKAHQEYLEFVVEKYYKSKSFLIKDSQVPLYDFYVPLGLSSKKQHFPQASILDLRNSNNFSVIMATGGSGKSMMMRHLFLNSIEEKGEGTSFH